MGPDANKTQTERYHMCGLFGVALSTKENTQENKGKILLTLRALAVLNEQRGYHSTGVAVVDPTGITVRKSTAPAADFVNSQHWDLMAEPIGTGTNCVILGHTRMASIGSIHHTNAHPHVAGNGILTHNGTVDNFDVISKLTKVKSDCDSVHLANLLATTGDVYPATGAITFAAIDTKTGELFLRRQGRQLACAETSQGSLFWSSKIDDLYTSTDISNVQTDCVWSLEEGSESVVARDTDDSLLLYKVPIWF